jgi:hypothetical protein
MKIFAEQNRRGGGFRTAIQYQWNGDKMTLVSSTPLTREQVRESVREMAGAIRTAKKNAFENRIAQVKTGGQE